LTPILNHEIFITEQYRSHGGLVMINPLQETIAALPETERILLRLVRDNRASYYGLRESIHGDMGDMLKDTLKEYILKKAKEN
jgi:hypothetical protein